MKFVISLTTCLCLLVLPARATLPLTGVGDAGGGAAFVGDLDTAPNAIVGYWGMEAASAALRGPTNYVIRVCEPDGATCFNVGTDASTGQITPAIVATATGANATCNNTTNVCTIGGASDPGAKALYDQSGGSNNATVSVGHAVPNFVVPVSVGGGSGCPSPFNSTSYCMQSTGGTSSLSVTASAGTCPCAMAIFAVDTSGAIGEAGAVGFNGGNYELESRSGVLDYYNGALTALSDTVANQWYDVIGGDGPSGYVAANRSSGNTLSHTQSSITTSGSITGVSGSSGWVGYLFKAAIWNANAGNLAVSSANAATMISNTCTRATGSATC